MQYLTLATILSTTLLATASPTPSIKQRACSTAYPVSIGFPINYDIHQDAGATNKRDATVSFNSVPAGSYGCQLEVNFPAGYPITTSGASQVNVYTASGPNSGSLFGTVNFASSPVAPTKFVINSAQCDKLMSYRLSIASTELAGRVAFADTKDAGITMTYNC